MRIRSLGWLGSFLCLVSSLASASDRTLDFSTGCKLYRLENKAWAAEDAAAFEGMQLSNSQILKNEKFTVFKTDQGTYGVNQKCVGAGIPGDGQPAVTAAPATQPSKPVARRASAAKPRGKSLLDQRGKWAASVALGLNISPKGTTKITRASTGASDEAANPYTGSFNFIGDASYRVSHMFRVAGEIGVSQLQESSSVGNETSYIGISPEFIIRGSPSLEYYFGPTVGLFFLAENAATGTIQGNGTATKQQTASSTLIGVVAGADYALSDQFDVGLFLRYFKPGPLKVTIQQTTPTLDTLEAVRSVSYMTFGARFQIHF